MNDKVLTDDEKDALLEGVENGEVEVQSKDGRRYAGVENYVIAPRNRLVSNSYPRLQGISRNLAADCARAAAALLNDKVECEAGAVETSTWGEFLERCDEPALLFEFTARPLDGSAVMHVRAQVVRHLVENFFGGSRDNPPRHDIDGFTPGEHAVVALLCNEILTSVVEHWQSVIGLEAAQAGIHSTTDIIEVIDSGSTVITTELVLHVDGEALALHVAWPMTMLRPVLPVLEGAKRDRDAGQDAHWEQVLRARVPEALIGVSSCIGHARMTLREVAALAPGDIINFENPRIGTVFARNVPVLEGRFGVHDGCYAIEATRWLSTSDDALAAG